MFEYKENKLKIWLKGNVYNKIEEKPEDKTKLLIWVSSVRHRRENVEGGASYIS